MDSKTKNRAAVQDGFFIAGMVLLLLFSLWKSRYGLGLYDEAFYLTIPYRMCHGDKLFLNEWNLSQLSALLQYPLMKLYLLIHPNTEGIVLAFRRIYVVVNFAAGLLAYRRLRKFGTGAAVAVLLYLLYAPYNIMALSYNSMGLLCGFLCAVYLATAAKNYDYVISGLFFAGIVLCQPLMLAEFAVVYIVLICVSLILKRHGLLRSLLLFLSGCVLLAIPVLVYFVFYVGITNVLAALPQMMNDPQHDMGQLLSVSFIYESIVSGYLPNIFMKLPLDIEFYSGPVLKALYFSFIPIWVAVFLDCGRNRRAALYLSVSALPCVGIGAVYMLLYPYSPMFIKACINFILFPWLLQGVCLFPFLSNPDDRRLLLLFYALGFLHTLSFLTSNQTGNVFCIALLPSCLASIMLSIKYCLSLGRVKMCRYMVYICTTVCAALLLYVRASYCFASPPVSALDTRCSSGPSAGLILSGEQADYLSSIAACVEEKQLRPGENTLFLTPESQFYLCSDTILAQYSAWMPVYLDLTPARLEAYYSLNPDKRPDAIFIEKSPMYFGSPLSGLGSTISAWAEEHGFSFEEDDVCFFMRRLPG